MQTGPETKLNCWAFACRLETLASALGPAETGRGGHRPVNSVLGKWRLEVRNSGHPQLHSELEVSLDHTTSCLTTTTATTTTKKPQYPKPKQIRVKDPSSCCCWGDLLYCIASYLIQLGQILCIFWLRLIFCSPEFQIITVFLRICPLPYNASAKRWVFYRPGNRNSGGTQVTKKEDGRTFVLLQTHCDEAIFHVLFAPAVQPNDYQTYSEERRVLQSNKHRPIRRTRISYRHTGMF